ncbi:Zinc-type alcohol dehydrogenase-like protein [Sphaceloma murrayae]|uniref:Zinc-type alcohol dehydrogenase-like protein n=1 Tax=Sphaceloma murrayae TaxID=2082308 RepID=A0A2K1QLM1_9PEZI|nr:Zinc-type alcohol dehydrogenase-like protein [Sphaceloma murrayae]
MADTSTPSTMRIWQYDAATPTMHQHLELKTSQPVPQPKPDQHLIKVLAVGLNPVDYKIAEAPYVGGFIVKKPATPGLDISGRIVTPAAGSNLKPGDLVYGASSTNPFAGNGLAEYVAAPATSIAPVPGSISTIIAGGVPVAAMTAWDSLVPYIRSGSRVFINGGSGGVGTYGIQIAKGLGAHVTVACSSRNAELCRSLGADVVLDYTERPLLEQLREAAAAPGRPFDHVVDYVFSDPALFYEAHTYTAPEAKFVEVAGGPSWAFIKFALGAHIWPGFLGGGKRKFEMFACVIKTEGLVEVANWIKDGRIKPVTDKVFEFEKTVEAFEYLRKGRAVGKVVVTVATEEK